jgi:hypothetical protein
MALLSSAVTKSPPVLRNTAKRGKNHGKPSASQRQYGAPVALDSNVLPRRRVAAAWADSGSENSAMAANSAAHLPFGAAFGQKPHGIAGRSRHADGQWRREIFGRWNRG